MSKPVIYTSDKHIRHGLPIMTIREHLCGFFEDFGPCNAAQRVVDTESGHDVCSACGRITVESGLRKCDVCNTEYINPNKRQDNNYETNCPRCVEKYGLEDDE